MPPNKQPAATRMVPKHDARVPVSSPTKGDPREELRTALAHSIVALKARKLAGTTHLSFEQLFDSATALMITAKATKVSPAGPPVSDVGRWLQEVSVSPNRKALVLARPGEGKTTASVRLYYELATAYLANPEKNPFPILIDLRAERNAISDKQYGPRDWLLEFLSAHYGALTKEFSGELGGPARRICVILDALDEVLAGRPFPEVGSIVERQLFADSAVVFCRAHFYQQYLQYLPFTTDREIIALTEWTPDDVDNYVRAFSQTVWKLPQEQSSGTFLEWMHGAKSLQSILRVPIRLNMALDLYSPDGESFPKHPSLLQLYEAYICRSINMERSRTNVDLENTYQLLEDLAWEAYGERDTSSDKTSVMTERSLRTFLSIRSPKASSPEIETDLSYVLNLGLISLVPAPLPTRDPSMDFAHKSFVECLVATRALRAMTSSALEIATMCASYLTPEVSEFLKEAIDQLNTQPRQVSKAVRTLIDGISRARTTDLLNATSDSGRRRLMIEQLCYYLGNLESNAAQTFLLKLIDTEPDEWIRRGIAVGLAFGGQYKPLEKYIDELRQERLSNAATPKSEANFGFHLSFFGDQPFDPEYPDKDMGFDACGKTVARLIYQLGTDTNRPNWRIDLYTLLDLQYREKSRESYWASMRDNGSHLRRVLERFSETIEVSTWTETVDLRRLLDRLETR
jgi:hypothetical protein